MMDAAPFTLEDRSCPCGCERDDEHVLSGSDRLHNLPGTFSVVKCRRCGLLRTNPRPSPDRMGLYYPPDYGPYVSTRVTARKWPGWDFGAQAIPHLKPGHLLEIGCASGSFLHRMAQQGWSVEGIEFSPQAAAAASALGYHVQSGPLEKAAAPAQSCDLVVGWMVLEHLHDPVVSLRQIRTWTRRDSWLAISVPNAASFEFRAFGSAWFALHLPNHLFHFTPATIAAVLRVGGWQVRRILFQRDLSNTVASLGYKLRERGLPSVFTEPLISYPWWGGRANIALLPLSYLLSLLGQTGRMTVWAQHAEEGEASW